MRYIEISIVATLLSACGGDPSAPDNFRGLYVLHDLNGATLPTPVLGDANTPPAQLVAGYVEILDDTVAFRNERFERLVDGTLLVGEYGTSARYARTGNRITLRYLSVPVAFAPQETFEVAGRALILRQHIDVPALDVVRRFCLALAC